MNFNFWIKPIFKIAQLGQYPIGQAIPIPFGKKLSRFIFLSIALLLTDLIAISATQAAGDAKAGKEAWIKTCEHCHGSPQPNSKDAFSDYDTTANRLSVYASDPAAITKTATEGYIVPEGNTNDKVPVGKLSKEEMGTFAGMAPNKLGYGTTPTQYAINISAYFASLFDVPGAPTISSVTAGNEQASVSFSAPKSDLTISSYTVISNPGGFKGTGTSSPITVSGLTNGTAYTFTVTATSNSGTGKSSVSSIAVTPITSIAPAIPPANLGVVSTIPATAGVVANSNVAMAKATPPINSITPAFDPNAPTIVNTRAGNAQARVFFAIPAGVASSISKYTVTALSGGVTTGITATGAKSPITVSGLTNGADYTFTVTANINTGKNLLSAPSDSVTPLRILGD